MLHPLFSQYQAAIACSNEKKNELNYEQEQGYKHKNDENIIGK